MTSSRRLGFVAILVLTLVAGVASAQDRPQVEPAPDRGNQGEGPFERLIIRGANVIDGTGAPPAGPRDIVIEQNRIVEIKSVGTPHVAIDESKRPSGATKEIDAAGMFVMPGFVDLHTHTGGVPKAPEAEYVYKLWMAHGVTTTRDAGAGARDQVLSEKKRSAANEIVAPRIFAYARPGTGDGWDSGSITTAEQAREWVRWGAEKGIDGLKLGAYDPHIMEALIDEAKLHNLGTMAHLGQNGVGRMNVLDAARLGLGTQTHYYGLFEALLKDYTVQDWPIDQNHGDEQHRFGQVPSLESNPPTWKRRVERARRRARRAQPDHRPDDDDLRCRPQRDGGAQCRLARAVHAPVAVGFLPAEPQEPRRVLVLLDLARRNRVA